MENPARTLHLVCKAALVAGLSLSTSAIAQDRAAPRSAPMSAMQATKALQGGLVAANVLSPAANAPAPGAVGLPVDAGREAPDVFGSMALPVRKTRLDAKWRLASTSVGGLGRSAGNLLASLRSRSAQAQALAVNSWVNARVRFVPDAGASGADRWATAAETLNSGRGDCEDYAIAKMQLLRSLGVSPRDLYFVVAYDLVRRQDHAVLVMRAGDALLLLNSDSDRIADATAPSDFRPILSFSAGRAWTHGYRTETRRVRYALTDPAAAGVL